MPRPLRARLSKSSRPHTGILPTLCSRRSGIRPGSVDRCLSYRRSRARSCPHLGLHPRLPRRQDREHLLGQRVREAGPEPLPRLPPPVVASAHRARCGRAEGPPAGRRRAQGAVRAGSGAGGEAGVGGRPGAGGTGGCGLEIRVEGASAAPVPSPAADTPLPRACARAMLHQRCCQGMSWQHLNQPQGWIGVISLSLSPEV